MMMTDNGRRTEVRRNEWMWAEALILTRLECFDHPFPQVLVSKRLGQEEDSSFITL